MYPNQQPQNQQGGYPPQPQPPTQQGGYGPQPQPTYAVDYLDQIAPPPQQQKFLSGGFGKLIILFGLLILIVMGVIVAIGNDKGTGPIEQMSIKLENFSTIADDRQKQLKNSNLIATNSNFRGWLTGATSESQELVSGLGIPKNKLNKEIVASESAKAKKLSETLEDARLNAMLDQIYAREMTLQTKLIKTELDTIAKKAPTKQVRDFAIEASKNIAPIQEAFSNFDESL